MLAGLPAKEWHSKYYKKLSGECEGLWEIRFEADGVEQRPLGFQSDGYEFTILLWAQEKNGRFVPPNACEQALRRKADAQRDRKHTNVLWLGLE